MLLITFICLFFLCEVDDLKASLASVLPKAQEELWLPLWDRVHDDGLAFGNRRRDHRGDRGKSFGLTAYLLRCELPAIALGLIAGFLDMIPNIGATIAGFILSLELVGRRGLTAALIMIAVVLIYQQVENSILTPTIQGKAVALQRSSSSSRLRCSARCSGDRSIDRRSRRRDDPDHPRRGHADLPSAGRPDQTNVPELAIGDETIA